MIYVECIKIDNHGNVTTKMEKEFETGSAFKTEYDLMKQDNWSMIFVRKYDPHLNVNQTNYYDILMNQSR